MSNFKPEMVGVATFANGSSFQIDKIKRNGACRITNLITKSTSYAHSISNAWKNVKYQAKVLPNTNNTHGWPLNRGNYE